MKRDVTTQELPRTFYSQFPELQTRGLDPTYTGSGLAMQHTRSYRAKHINEGLSDRKRCSFLPQGVTKSLHCLGRVKSSQVFREKNEDSPIHLRLRIVGGPEFVRLLTELPARMKRRSPYVCLGLVEGERRKAG